MAEMTRDEHVARAQELLRWAGLAYDGEGTKGHVTRSDFDSDAAYWEAVRTANEAYDLTLIEVNSLANWATAHAKLAEVLGQQVGERRWAPLARETHIRVVRGQAWQLVGGNAIDPGWFLFGPGPDVPGRYVAAELDAAKTMADALIATHEASQ